jgi:hypothetical protein
MYEGEWALLCDVRLEATSTGAVKVFRASGLACPACGSPTDEHGCTLEERSLFAVTDPGPGAHLVLFVTNGQMGPRTVYINDHLVDVGDDYPSWLGLYDALLEGNTFLSYDQPYEPGTNFLP